MRPAWVAWLALALLWGSCAGNPFPALATPQSCGDRCSVLNCPAGMRCSVDAQCSARCAPEQIGNHP